jgi:hypothetical protein
VASSGADASLLAKSTFHLTQRTEKLEFQDLYKITADNKEIEEKLLLSVL